MKDFTSHRKIVDYYNIPHHFSTSSYNIREVANIHNYKSTNPFFHIEHFHYESTYNLTPGPERGYDCLTYPLHGTYSYKDFHGSSGILYQNHFQLASAGKGLLRSECYSSEYEGIRIKYNIENRFKRTSSSYQNRKFSEMNKSVSSGIDVNILIGYYGELSSNVITKTPLNIFDIHMEKHQIFEHCIYEDWKAFVYVIDGSIETDEILVARHFVGIFCDGGRYIKFKTEIGARVLFCAGEPIYEPICTNGDIVMTSEKDVISTLEDYQNNSNGFEGASEFLRLLG